jgi:glycosyltransferase involved in cell wall biosynthesis
MKQVMDVYREIQNPIFAKSQISEVHWNKNVLFVNPQLNGRNFYKYVMPYIVMFEFDVWGTAITSIEKYKPNKEYEYVDVALNSRQILWADYIVFPFTHQDLKGLFDKVREINPDIKIVFNVDFNFYLLPKKHPLYDEFSSDEIKSNIEDNIFYSDITLVTNSKLSQYLVDKFKNELNEKKYVGKKSKVEIGTFPILLDTEIILENIQEQDDEEPEEKEVPEIKDNALRVGIVATNYIWEDINSYKELFKQTKEKLGDKIKFVLIGFDGIDNKTQKNCFPEGINLEIVKPCTIIHYFKQLSNLNLDLLFIPLRNTEFNQTSENYNKYLEAGMFEVPIMVYDVFPYSEIIKNGNNGIILKKKNEFLDKLEFFEDKREELKRMGKSAKELIATNFIYDKDNLPIIDKIYYKK